MFIKHDNLTIRNATAEDAGVLAGWWSDGKVMAHAGFPLGINITEEEVLKEIATDADDTFRRLIIEADNIRIGEMSFRNKGCGVAEIGIKICDFTKQEKGHGTKLIFMLISELFGRLGYEKIILDTNLNNKRAQHVYEKLGFRKVAEKHDCWTNQLGELQSAVDYEMTKEEYITHVRNYWYAYIYEQQVIQGDEVAFILETIGKEPRNVLEVACGGGRILAPIAKAGHTATGFDIDKYALERCGQKSKQYSNARCYCADALKDNWGTDYDIAILSGNVLINIVTDGDYMDAQKLFVQKAAGALKQGGHLYLDFDCYDRIEETSSSNNEWVCFEGTDDRGTYGKYIVISGEYDPVTRMNITSSRRFEITPQNGEMFAYTYESLKHYPTLYQVHEWLSEAGFTVEWEYGGYDRRPIDESVIGNRAIIWAKKL